MRRLPILACFAVLITAGCAARTVPPPAPPPGPTLAEETVRLAHIMRLMELNRQRVQLELEVAGNSQRLGENHPDMVRLRRQLSVIDAAIAREGNMDEARLKQDANSAEAQTELALLYMRDGKFGEAEQALTRALALIKARTAGR